MGTIIFVPRAYVSLDQRSENEQLTVFRPLVKGNEGSGDKNAGTFIPELGLSGRSFRVLPRAFHVQSLLTESVWAIRTRLESATHAPISFPEAAILLVSDGDRDFWPGPTPEVRNSRTSCHSAHAQSQV